MKNIKDLKIGDAIIHDGFCLQVIATYCNGFTKFMSDFDIHFLSDTKRLYRII